MAKKQNITLSELVISNPNLPSLKDFEGLKQQLDERAKQCLLIKVTDEASLNVCENNLSKMNDLVTAIEDKHKEIKEPHWNNCKAIDNAKNYILDFEIDPIKYLKDEKLAYINKLAAEKKRKDDLNILFDRVKSTLITHLEEASPKSCEDYIATLSKPVNKEKWQELVPQVEELYKNYITLFELKKTELEALETATPDEIEAIKQVQEEAKAKIEVVSVVTPIYSAPIGKTRKTWKFEVANIADVPKEWLMVDADKVDEWKNANKATLVDGQVVKGIKFYQAVSVIA